jgi:uncharacterized protein with FMN-binding domain
MKRAILALSGTAAGLAGVLSFHPHAHALVASGSRVTVPATGSAVTTPAPSATPAGSGSASAATGSSPAPATSSSSASASKTITGSAIDTRYGAVQVQITVQGKKLTDVQVLQAPQNSGRDQEISSYSLPMLHDEALSAQSANIQYVSGATFTSDGYIQSLQSALDQM